MVYGRRIIIVCFVWKHIFNKLHDDSDTVLIYQVSSVRFVQSALTFCITFLTIIPPLDAVAKLITNSTQTIKLEFAFCLSLTVCIYLEKFT